MRITADVVPLQRLDAGLASITRERIEEVEVGVINAVTERTYDRSRAGMIRGINLPDAYLRERMSIVPAGPGNLQSIIRAGYRHTLLSRYAPQPVVKPGPRGKPLKAGVSVEVTRGVRKTLPGAFLMRLKNGNGLGVFVRTGGKLKVLYGPSVYQLFRATVEVQLPETIADLEQSSVLAVSKLMREAIS